MSARLNIYLSDEIADRISSIADRQGRSRSNVIVTLLDKLSEDEIHNILHGGRSSVHAGQTVGAPV